ncbi:MAG: hypothetical protein M3Q29_03225 [Chloroflexota bacterium]|nr:hypothetical protein [Chloroflexota bacterium]
MYRQRIRLDYQCPDLIPGHVLRVSEVVLDEEAIRVEYSIEPALPNMPPIMWRWEARDDLGNRYEEAGGAYGPSRNGDRTEGVLSLTPLPAAGARLFSVILNPWIESESETRQCSFDVDLADLPG